VRTTLTLDDDVAAKLKAAAKGRSFRAVVNDALRAGLAALEKRVPLREPYQTRGFDLGPSLVGSLDNVEEVLSRAEGERHT
jgi:plasmid stability protein